MKKWTHDDGVAMDARWTAGDTLAAIGADYGISGTRVRQLIGNARHKALTNWKLANGWTIDRPGGRWIDPPMPWPKYDKPVR